MKKTLLFASCLLAAVAFTACEDDTNDAGNDGGTTAPALTPDEAIAAFNTKYDLEATLDVDTATFCYASPDGQMFRWVNGRADENGDSIPDFVGQYFVPADNEYVGKVLNFLETEVFPVFGEEFISKYMPRTIYFASEVQYHPYYSNRNIGLINLAKDIHYAFEGGTCCPEFIMFSHCCSDFDTMDKTYLKGLYTSLVVEYIYSNIANSTLDEPAAFNQYSIDYTVGVDFGFMIFSLNENCDGYYDSSAEDFETGWTNESIFWNSFEEITNSENLWNMPTVWFQSELRPGRVGVNELTLYDEQTATEYGYPSLYCATYYRASLAQVLGDYVAFIVTTTAAEKEAFYAQVQDALDKADTEEGSSFPTEYLGGENAKTVNDVLPDIKARVELCKEYFASYGVILNDKQ